MATNTPDARRYDNKPQPASAATFVRFLGAFLDTPDLLPHVAADVKSNLQRRRSQRP